MAIQNERLNRLAARQLETIGRSSGLRYTADRGDILRSAQALIGELDAGDPEDLYDVLAVASFLAGDGE